MCPTPPDEAAAPTRSKRRRSPVPRRDSGQDGIPMTVKQTESKRSRSNEYAHLAPLFDELVGLERGDPRHAEVRECLVTGYLPLAEHIAQRFSGKGIAKEDLVQVASVGLIHAVDRFDPGQGADFLSYAVPTVMGEVRRHFRDTSWPMRVPRRLQELRL